MLKNKNGQRRTNEELEKERKALYRHYLLLNIQRGMDVVVPQDEFAAQECRRAVQEAKIMFLEVHGEDHTQAPSQDTPEFQYKINVKGRQIQRKVYKYRCQCRRRGSIQ